jgi:hypothetical protein
MGNGALINASGEFVIAPQFHDLSGFNSSGIAVFIDKKNKCGCINSSGNIIIEPKYDDIEFTFDDNILEVRLKNKQGYISIDGNWISDYVRDH